MCKNYISYLKNIELFINSPKADQYRAKYFANVITKEKINEI